MALGQAEEDIDALRRLMDADGNDYYEIASKIAILEGAHHLLDREVISKALYRDIINELLLKDIPMDEINLYAGLT